MGGAAFEVDVDSTLLEGFEHCRFLQEIFDRDLVVIVEPDLGRDILSPVIRIALVNDALSRGDLLDQIGAGTDRWFQCRLVERIGVDRVFRQDRGGACQDQRKLAVGLFVEGEAHAVFPYLFHFRHQVEPRRKRNAALVLENFHGEDHIIRRHRLAVRPAGLGVQVELNECALIVPFDRFRQQAVKREGFVARAGHQRFVNQVAESRIPDAAGRGADALQVEGIEAVIGADHAITNRTALLYLWVDVVEMAIVCGQVRRAVHGNTVNRGCCQR
ncbi:hypothetical protein D3C80_703190 [compost metagenome]